MIRRSAPRATADAGHGPAAASGTLSDSARRALLAALPDAQRAEAALRFDAQAPLLLDRLQRLYGQDARFETFCTSLFAAIGRLHALRPPALRALDAERQQQPDWFLDPQMLGYCAYVDRFAGTLNGVAERVPYLRELGVRYLHLLPFLKMRAVDNDGGFAVSSFEDVEPSLGTMADLEALTARLRSERISLCADFVLNHVADDHAWAQAAKQGDARHRAYFHCFPDRREPDAYEAQLGEVFPTVAPGNFTQVPELGAWVWTTFYPYQWDLNYANPDVFAEIAQALLKLANHGIEVFRLDSSPFLWKRAGTACVNQPEVHWVLQALRAIVEIAAPGVLLKAEAIVPIRDLPPYFGRDEGAGRECHLAYHSSLMAAGWAAIAEQRSELLQRVIAATPALPGAATWLTYVRCHDDIVWSALKPEIEQGGQTLDARLAPVSRFLAGQTPGSFAHGAAFQTTSEHAVFGTNGMSASLLGIDRANGEAALQSALRRLRLLYALAFSVGGLPLIYMGDELAQGNDESADSAALRAADGRWLQRPRFDVEAARAARTQPGSLPAQAWTLLRELVQQRQRLPMLAAGVSRRIIDCADPAVLVLARGESFVAVMNFSDQPKALAREAVLGAPTAARWLDCFSGRPVPATLELAPWDLCWLERGDAAQAG